MLKTIISSRTAQWVVAVILLIATMANFQGTKAPNILVIFGDDIGWMNVSS
jgi:hypothetical protein